MIHIDGDQTIKGQYNFLATEREDYERIAEQSSLMTDPSLFVFNDNDINNTQNRRILRAPDQSVGAIGLNNLATSLLLAIFPPNAPFFRNQLDQESLNKLERETEEAGGDFKGLKSELEQSLRKVENSALEILEGAGVRPVLFEILKQYLLAQVLIYLDPKTDQMRGFKLSQHVNVRDQMGNVLLYITEEIIDPSTLSEKIRKEADINLDKLQKESPNTAQRMGLYTKIQRVSGKKWESVQEINDVVLESTRQKFTDETLPWFDIAYTRILGEPYGRGYIQQLLGHLRSLNGLMKALVEGSLIASRTIFQVDPASSTTPEQLVNVPNGGFVRGRQGEVTVLRVEKNNDFRTAQEAIQFITKELQLAFMSNLAARRDAERVTAEEFASIAAEIDQTLGGTFSRLAVEWQLPVARLTMKSMQRKGLVKNLRAAGVKPTVVTGIAALGRGTDLNRLKGYLTDIQVFSQTPGLETLGQGLQVDEVRLRLANGYGINASGLLKSEQDIIDENQAAQEAVEDEQDQERFADLTKAAIANPEGAEQVLSGIGQEAAASGQAVAPGQVGQAVEGQQVLAQPETQQ